MAERTTIYLDDAINLLEELETKRLQGDVGLLYAPMIKGLKALPSAQPEVLACGEGELIAQPEIVQCEDCQHWEQETINDGYCTEMDLRMCDADFYCGYAVRRTDEA